MYARNAAQQLLAKFLDPWAYRLPRVARALPKYDGKRMKAAYNRWTGQPHEHRREIARRTTAPGTDARRAAMAQASGRA